ncbi:S-adenosyl-L-methionine-dependent methyltransferase, partial [Yasminevirus sp. GU-2018]
LIEMAHDTNFTEVEKKYVVEAYDDIANGFDKTRYKPWPKTVEFVQSLAQKSSCLEVGCGNGKNLFREDIEMIGLDSSSKLVEIARSKGKNVVVGDGCDLPFLDDRFDAVMSIAVLHHVHTFQRQTKFLQEMLRVCKIGGKVMIEVWATTDPKFTRSSPLENGDPHDRVVSFCSKSDEVQKGRYYHFYEKNELEDLIYEVRLKTQNSDQVPCKKKKFSGNVVFDSNNWTFVGEVCSDTDSPDLSDS